MMYAYDFCLTIFLYSRLSSQFYLSSPKSQITNLPQGNKEKLPKKTLNGKNMEKTSGRDTEEGIPLPGRTDVQ